MNITSYSNSPIVSILDNVIKNQNGKSYLLKELTKKKIYIYGCGMGYYTFKTFILKKYNIQPVAVIDQKFNQKGYKHQFDGVQTYGTEDPILKDTKKKMRL